tara:strand:+ start:3187 stop:3627 length:441 start_codon:yes stop_codon:yes gene_type:complete
VKTLWIDHEHEAFSEWVALRQQILRDPLGLKYSEQDLADERQQRHLVGWIDEAMVGGLIVNDQEQDPGVFKIRQVAVSEAFQSRGIGRILMVEAMVWIQNQGIQKIVLHSREPVISFYEKLGFVAEGEVFHEVGIPHRRMVIQLEN